MRKFFDVVKNNTKVDFERSIKEKLPKYSFLDVWKFKHVLPLKDDVMLYAFREEKDVKLCRVITDQIVGGKTTATISHDKSLSLDSNVKLKREDFNFRTFYDSTLFKSKEEESPGISEIGSCKFSGDLSLELPPNNKTVERSGFACMQTPKAIYSIDLDTYTGLELRLRSDGRIYVVQIKTDTNLEDDLYQCILPVVPTNQWCNVYLPFSDFLLTWRGYADESQPQKELHSVRHFAILMAERSGGPFNLHIDWIKATRKTSTERIIRIRT